MPSFSNGKKEPEPGRPVSKHEIIKETTIQNEVDVDAIAKAVALALGKMPTKNIVQHGDKDYDDGFSDSKSLEKLADSMIVQRGNSESNFEDLGGTQETKKDSKEVNKTIDLLKGLDD